MKVNVGDDVTIAGTIIEKYGNIAIYETAKGNKYATYYEDIKTVRPGGNNGGGTRSIIKGGENVCK